MQYADRPRLRETMYRANVTRAAEFGKPEWDNTPLIARILPAARARRRALLGYANYAEVSLVPKMAETPAAGARRSSTTWRRAARPFAERDLAELREFARERARAWTELEAWDIAYASEKLRAARYAFSDQEVKQYFPEHQGARRHVPPGGDALRHAHRAPTRRPSGTRTCASSASRDDAGELVGQFYLDLYARDTKRGGAWMDDAITRRRRRDGHPDPGRLPHLQLLRPRWAASRRFHPRRRASRCSTSSATACTTC